MSKNKLPQISAKQVGKNLNVKVDDGTGSIEVFTLTGDKETLAPVKGKIAEYLTKPVAKLLTEIKKLLTPKTTKENEKKEKAVTETKAAIKKVKNEAKLAPKVKNIQKDSKTIAEKIANNELTPEELADIEKAIQAKKVASAPKVETAFVKPRSNREW